MTSLVKHIFIQLADSKKQIKALTSTIQSHNINIEEFKNKHRELTKTFRDNLHNVQALTHDHIAELHKMMQEYSLAIYKPVLNSGLLQYYKSTLVDEYQKIMSASLGLHNYSEETYQREDIPHKRYYDYHEE